MHNVDMNISMANRCNIQILFSYFNKYNVKPSFGEYGQRWGLSYPQEKSVSKRGPKGRLIMGINPNPYF
jgi:hypothetical protein